MGHVTWQSGSRARAVTGGKNTEAKDMGKYAKERGIILEIF
jgi:hypothetical protein